MGVAMDLKTIGGKDWYAWGSEVILATQLPDGSWHGNRMFGDADTCFALLFLTRANLTKDLTASLRGRIKDTVVLRADKNRSGEPAVAPQPKSGGEASKPAATETSPLTKNPDLPRPADAPKNPDAKPIPSRPAVAPSREAAQLARDLVTAAGSTEQEAALRTLREGKGVEYTEALALAIPQLKNGVHRQARQALADRLARMKDSTLVRFLKDEDVEIRRAAALACAMKDSKDLVPRLIPLLTDPEATVTRAAHAALKELTSQSFGPTREVWEDWWEVRKK
jgi:hypothetical protein